MRPIKLRMTAFGPYKFTEVIDFNELEQNDLFVISGNTGAGKTTIFDGICFALYGSASGSDRENNTMLRSDFAEDHTHTAVELEFELQGKNYRILRQLGHIKQGNKTKTGDRFEFYERLADGKEVPCVDRQMVSEIDKKVETLMGLTQDQFKQIVMLPQGEFRKLLTSQTENKEEILRRLFKTDSYKQIGERLRERRRKVETTFNQEKQVRDTYIQHISASLPNREDALIFQVLGDNYYNTNQIITGLEEEAIFYQEKTALDQKKYEEAYKAHHVKQQEYHQAQSLNERFEELEQKAKQLQNLSGQTPLFAEKEKQLEHAERASTIEPYEKQVSDWRLEVENKTKALEHAERLKKEANDNFEKAVAIYKQEEARKSERDDWNRKLNRLEEFLPIVQDIDVRKNQIYQLKQEAIQTHEQAKALETEIEKMSKGLEESQGKIRKLDQAVSELPDKHQRRTEMRDQWKVLEEFVKLQTEQNKLQLDAQNKKQFFDLKKEEYTKLEQNWLSHQANMLASHLHDGEACPVCGSVNHPQKATVAEGAVTREQLEAWKKALDEADSQYRNVVAQLNANAEQLDNKNEEVAEYGIAFSEVETVKEQLKKDGLQLKAEIDRLEVARKELANLKAAADKAQSALKEKETRKSKLDQSLQEQKLAYQTARAVYEERIKNIPEEIRVLSELEKRLKETRALIEKLARDWENAQKNMQKAQEDRTKANSNMEHGVKQLNEAENRRQQAEKQFNKALEEAEFESEAAYRQAQLTIEVRRELKASIDQFKQNLSIVSEQVNELKEVLKDKIKVDLTALEKQLIELKQNYETALNEWNQSKDCQMEVDKLIKNITDSDERVKESEAKLSTITDLYDVIRGQNSQKISFERYLQIEYLEQIIDAANQRLRPLSNGQFNLIRSDRQETHGRQSGLALDVHDSYTGQTRDVKTLSGGEKFNASLCLALGMSDVIQSFQGNISIKTMFIDEGFGSLDEESLNKSIDTLVDLQQSGRMIGVISHVQELKSIFPAVLEVKKTKEGYSRTQFVIR